MSAKKTSKLLFLLFLVVYSVGFNTLKSQTTKGFEAKDYFKHEDYNRALIQYLKLYRSNKNDLTINERIGICYLNVNEDKTKAIPYLEYVYKTGSYKSNLLLYLGKAYMYDYEFNKAITFFNQYKQKTKSKKLEIVNHHIKNCESAKKIITHPVNVTFKNLGKYVNSKYPDYNPFVTKDQGTLFFTSSRITNLRKIKSSEGFFTSDIYSSKVINGEWGKVRGITTAINTAEDEKCVYVSPDGSNMIIYIDNEVVYGDLFSSSIKNKRFQRPKPFNTPVNTKGLELEGCLTNDSKMLIISSKRNEGFGETDLYMLKKLPSGKWGIPMNLGPNVNTSYKEAFPRYDEVNNILYFSSEGHDNMGGFDIFKSQFDTTSQTFGKSINIGYPINTPEDNMQFSLSGNKRDGYISAYREEGLGDLDIYNLIFNDVEVRISVVKGIITISDTLNQNVNATVSIFNKETNKKVEAKKANKNSGKYVFAIEPGKYVLTVASPNFKVHTQEITIYDKSDSDYIFEIEKNIILERSGLTTGKSAENSN